MMRVRLTVTVEVDPAEWAAEYGTDSSAKAVREDVRTYFHTHLNGADAAFSGLADVSVDY